MMNKIKYVSKWVRIIFQIIALSLPIILILSWVSAPDSLILPGGVIKMSVIPSGYLAHGKILHALTFSEKVYGCLLSAVPLLVNLFILYSLTKLFRLYETGVIFSSLHVRYLRNIGVALLLGQLIDPIYQLLIGLVLTLNNPPGHRFMAVTLDQTNLAILFSGVIVILISWIMAEGYKLQEDQSLTI